MSPTSYRTAPPRVTQTSSGLEMVGLGRFELPTSRLSGVRSNQLSYRLTGLLVRLFFSRKKEPHFLLCASRSRPLAQRLGRLGSVANPESAVYVWRLPPL